MPPCTTLCSQPPNIVHRSWCTRRTSVDLVGVIGTCTCGRIGLFVASDATPNNSQRTRGRNEFSRKCSVKGPTANPQPKDGTRDSPLKGASRPMGCDIITFLQRCVRKPDESTLRAWLFCKLLSKRGASDVVGRVWLPEVLWERCRRLIVVTAEPERCVRTKNGR